MKSLVPSFILEKYTNRIFHGKLKAIAMIIDISGFTPLTERLAKHGKEGAEILSCLINEVFAPCILSIHTNNGFIAAFIGDAVLAIFDKDKKDALLSAYKIRKAFINRKKHETKFGEFEISAKIAMSFGEIEWGIIGKGSKKSYYFRGEGIDACYFIEKYCHYMDIAIDDSLYDDFVKYSELQSVSEGYHRVLTAKLKKGTASNINTEIPKYNDYKCFIPDILLESRPINELRDVVSIFVLFRDTKISYDELCELFSVISNLCEKWGGFYRRINFDDKGCNILINFGIPLSFENNVLRALKCIQEIRSIYTSSVKAGITRGVLFAGFIGSKRRSTYDVLGDAVNLSARIAVNADWGTLCVSEVIKNNAKRHYGFKYLDKCRYKGKSEAIKTYLLKDKKLSGAGEIYKGKLFGRDDEIASIRECIDTAMEGKFGGIFYVYGDAGIGKSRLIHEAFQYYRDSAMICCLQCDSIIRKSWDPFINFLITYFEQNKSLSGQQNEIVFKRIHNKLLDDIKRNPGILDELIRTESFLRALLSLNTKGMLYEKLDPKGKFENTLYAVKELFKALSLISPVIIHLEDMHWLDDYSKLAIENLILNIDDFPIIILCSSRFNDDGTKPSLNFSNETVSTEIILSGISDQSVRAMIKETTGHYPDNYLLQFIRERTSNNPFYIEQFTLYLKAYGFIRHDANTCSLSRKTDDIPSGIKQILIARIDRLTREVRELTRIASVLGMEFDSNILFKSIESLLKIRNKIKESKKNTFDISTLRKILEKDRYSYLIQGQNEKIWDTPDYIKYIFSHSILRESVYDMQLRERLRIIHETAAETIENTISNIDNNKRYYLDLAYHFERAENHEKTRIYLGKAGDYLKNTYNNTKAIEIYANLLNYISDNNDIIAVTHKLGGIYELIGKWDEAEKTYHKALKISKKTGNKSSIANSMSKFGHIFISRGEIEKAKRFIRQAVRIALEADNKAICLDLYTQLGGVYFIESKYEKAIEYCRKAIKLALAIKDKIALSKSLGNLANIYRNTGDTAKTKMYSEKSLQLARETGDLNRINRALFNIGLLYKQYYNLDKAKECFYEGLDISMKIGDKNEIAIFYGALGDVFRKEKNLPKAIELMEKQLQIYRETGDKYNIGNTYGNLGVAFYHQGQYEKAMDYYQKALEISQEIGNIKELIWSYNQIGALYAVNRDYDHALRYYNMSVALSESTGDKVDLNSALANLGELYFDKGEYETAIDYYDKAIQISISMNNLHGKFYFTCHKAKILYDIGRFDESEKINNEVQISLKMHNYTDIAFLSQILAQKIRYKLSDNNSIRKKCLKILEEVLNLQTDDENRAMLNYELFLLTLKDKYRKNAIQLYEELFKMHPRTDYRNALNELRRSISHEATSINNT